MPESNGLIQGLSTMESRACQAACNQQPFPLSDGVEGKQCVKLNGAFVLGLLCLYIWPGLQMKLCLHAVPFSPPSIHRPRHPVFWQFSPSNLLHPLRFDYSHSSSLDRVQSHKDDLGFSIMFSPRKKRASANGKKHERKDLDGHAHAHTHTPVMCDSRSIAALHELQKEAGYAFTVYSTPAL